MLIPYVLLGAALFALGLIGFVTRRNLIIMFLCTEMMFQGIIVNLVAFGRYPLNGKPTFDGQVFALFLIAVAAAEAALGWTLEYVRERQAFGQPIGSFQSSRFTLAELHGEVQIARVFVDQCARALNAGELTPEDAATAKWWCTDLQGRVVDRCLQLHGGYGYMLEYPIARAFADARVTRIYGGANEIMKEIVGRSLGL
jgi:alkylation response protein AidB-like acyl-CoA dehydrogenase